MWSRPRPRSPRSRTAGSCDLGAETACESVPSSIPVRVRGDCPVRRAEGPALGGPSRSPGSCVLPLAWSSSLAAFLAYALSITPGLVSRRRTVRVILRTPRDRCSSGGSRRAARVFERRGYADATLDDIAAEAGISKPTVYQYVSSKQRLLETIVEQAIYPLREGIEQIVG